MHMQFLQARGPRSYQNISPRTDPLVLQADSVQYCIIINLGYDTAEPAICVTFRQASSIMMMPVRMFKC